jgi:rfaE bifunctional protein kinase chain/domain
LNLESFDQKLTETISLIRKQAGQNSKITFVSGNFNIVHPGHLRLLKFAAECGDFLVVGVSDDIRSGVFVPQQLRMEGVSSISFVDHVCALHVQSEEFVALLKPDVVVKGKEHEKLVNCEKPIIEGYGGRLIFSSGETTFSSIGLLQQEFERFNGFGLKKPVDYIERHSIDSENLITIVKKFSSLNVIVIGDLIVDEYITCDPLGMSREDPTIVVTPIKSDYFIGAAGIVAAHARGLGAHVKMFSVVGEDPIGELAHQMIDRYDTESFIFTDSSRPTTLKQRYRANGKTLLRVSHLRQHDINQDLVCRLMNKLFPAIEDADLLIFSDFNYGCLPQGLVNEVINCCSRHGVMAVADSQSSSQIGDISRFQGMQLITPTEHEARLAVQDSGAGLAVLAEMLLHKAKADNVFITLGAEGMMVYAPISLSREFVIDQLPAFNSTPRDVAGAGDSLLTCSAMSLASGASTWESAYLGSIASACQVGRVGNSPLSANEIIKEILR